MNNVNDEDFINKLPKYLHKEYVQEKKIAIDKINAEWSKKSHVYDKFRWIKQETYHKDILNACLFPFVQQGRITENFDYKYIRSSPLAELDLPNVDFLIASEIDQTLIFGEAKGSATAPNNIITEYKKRIHTIEENFEYIQTEYLEGEKTYEYEYEYVLGIPSDDAPETLKIIHRSNANIILWQVNSMDDKTLSLAVPDTDDPQQLYRFMHNNNELNKTLKRVPTSTGFKTFFNESHLVLKMNLLITIGKRLENFSLDDVKINVRKELNNTNEEEIYKTSQEIVDCAMDIGFIKLLDNETYKIQSRHKDSGFRHKELRSKWVTRKIEMDNYYAIKNKIEEIQIKFSGKVHPLDDF